MQNDPVPLPTRRPPALSATALLCAIGVILSSSGRTADLTIATMRLGTSWYVFGATLYQLLKQELPSGSRVSINTKGGGIANPLLVNSGKAELGLANVATAVWARQGHPRIYRGRTQRNIRALVGGLNSVWFCAIAREAFIAKTGKASLAEIFDGTVPVRVVMKPRGSTVPVLADMVLEALGTSRQAIQRHGGRIVQISAKQIPTLLRDGRADVYFETATLGQPTVTEVGLTADVRFLDLPRNVINHLSKNGLAPSRMPAMFRGQTEPTRSVDLGTVLIAHKDLPEESAYLVTKTLCEHKEVMARAHKAWKHFDPASAGTRAHTGIPLHLGARRYFKERGWPTR